MTTYRLFPSTSGPSSPTSASGPFLAGVAFQVTAWNTWLEGYWWWVPPGGDTGSQKYALWLLYDQASSLTPAKGLVPAATVTSGTLTAGQWNFVPLTSPVQLTASVPYIAATGWTISHGFPETHSEFGSGQTYAAGITDGPLSAYSDIGGSAPSPSNWAAQGMFSTVGADPTVNMPVNGDSSSNFWMDLQVSDTPPAATSYRLWPSLPTPPNMIADTAANFTLATEFTLSQQCTVNRIWFYSPSGATQLPTEIGIYGQTSETLIAGTHNASPSWSGASGSGWVSCSYSGIALAAGSYRVAALNGAGSPGVWNNATINYWTSGAGGSGITTGPLSAPSESTADTPGQGSYNAGSSLVWPGTYDTGGAPSYWVDVEVTPASGSGMLMATFP